VILHLGDSVFISIPANVAQPMMAAVAVAVRDIGLRPLVYQRLLAMPAPIASNIAVEALRDLELCRALIILVTASGN
jgi:hypothetical protein